MIETREQYQEIIDTMPTQAIGKAMYFTATIEALRDVARAMNELPALSSAYIGAKGIEIPELTGIPTENYDALIEMLSALPTWLIEDD